MAGEQVPEQRYTPCMHLVATSSSDPEMLRLIWRFRDTLGRFHLHPVAENPVRQFLPGLGALEFAGAIILDPDEQEEVPSLLQRSSMEVQESGAADTITVTPAGLIGEYNFGRALGQLLKSAHWDAREARVSILGSGPEARAVAREVSSLGASELAVLATSRPEAEQSTPRLAASTRVSTRTHTDPLAGRHLLDSDLIVRLDARMSVPAEVLGPHLTIVDLAREDVSRLRSQALNMGALSFNRRDLQAHFLAMALSQILGGRIDAEPFLDLLHEGVR